MATAKAKFKNWSKLTYPEVKLRIKTLSPKLLTTLVDEAMSEYQAVEEDEREDWLLDSTPLVNVLVEIGLGCYDKPKPANSSSSTKRLTFQDEYLMDVDK